MPPSDEGSCGGGVGVEVGVLRGGRGGGGGQVASIGANEIPLSAI